MNNNNNREVSTEKNAHDEWDRGKKRGGDGLKTAEFAILMLMNYELNPISKRMIKQ
ncbi:uncharacterized protein Dsimw501_GD26783 [Drosophila simulans]|uniref:Uncharacterized protein n=1 Tax=Drosophila simulans TaxID=7240 RepID=A0A0J9QXG4_DROSI|nr:uncharacterized protein Dsimw501_GD26783 [Drosophila simulans]